MRAGAVSLSIGMIAVAAAIVFMMRPFELAFHSWEFAVVAALATVLLLVQGLAGVRGTGEQRWAALGALGGALVCGAIVSASFAVGRPHVLAGSPGQLTPLGARASLAVAFPAVSEMQLRDGEMIDAVTIVSGSTREEARVGQTLQSGQYVLRISTGPIALVRATTLKGLPVTVTQPQGATFVSPYLLFPGQSGEERVDFFAVPPVHRTANVTYYPSYRDDARHIYIASPFLLVQVAEENGAALFRGATISGRPLRGGGLQLTFLLGQYPSVAVASAPSLLPFALGALMLAAGLAGYAWATLRSRAV